MVARKEVEEFIDKNIGKDNFSFLSGYLRFSSSSRLQCSEIVFDAYKRLKNEEIGKELDPESRNNLAGALTIDILSKVMMSIEDLGAVIIALNDLNTFAKKFLEVESGIARNIYKELINKDDTFFYDLLTYPDITSLPVGTRDKELLEKVYQRNISVLKALFNKIIEFTEKHKKAFLKSKHGYPILLGIEKPDMAVEIDMIVPVIHSVDPSPQITLVLSGIRINELYCKLIRTISCVIKDIIFSKLQMIECAGSKQPLYRTYYQPSEFERQQIDEINKKCSSDDTKPQVKINLAVTGKESYIQELLEFFNKDWHIEG